MSDTARRRRLAKSRLNYAEKRLADAQRERDSALDRWLEIEESPDSVHTEETK